MLAYAANRPRIAARQSSPNTLLFIICGHIVLIAVVMSAKMGLPQTVFDPPTTVIQVPIDKPPPPVSAPVPHSRQQATPAPQRSEPTEVVPTVRQPQAPPDFGPPEALPTNDAAGTGTTQLPPLPKAAPVSSPAVPITSAADLKPPYPESKLLAGEEATLTLRLTVDEQGRVVAVDPVGRADPVFLSAARRHLIAHWRYKPAMQDGRAVMSSLVITLRFQLDD